jgi:hypothetical protein
MQSITVQGASVFCLINGELFGRVTGFSYTSETQRKPLYTIDHLDPLDLMPAQTRITGRLEVIRTKSDGGLEGAGIVAPYAFLANEKFITIMILAREANPRRLNVVEVPGAPIVANPAFPQTFAGFAKIPESTPTSFTEVQGNRTVIFRTDNAQVVNQSWQVNARGLMTGSFTFEALDWSNEVENAF